MMKVTNPPLFVLFVLFIFVNVVDSVTALRILPGEANPIYLLVGSFWWIILGKALLVFAVWFFYQRNIYPSNFIYYSLMLFMVMGIMILTIAMVSNIIGIQNPEVIEAASKVSAQQRVQLYSSFITVFYLLPIGLSLLSFKLYEWSLGNIKIDKEYYRRKRWWQI